MMAAVSAVPFTLVLEEFCEVKSDWSELEITHDLMPAVIQPRSDVWPRGTVFGLATKMMDGLLISTEH